MANPEAQIHRSIVAWLAHVMPGAVVHHSPNEHRRARGTAAMIHAVGNKRMGTVTGWPDLEIFPPAQRGPVFFEVKAPKGRLTDAQRDCHERLRRLGYLVAVVRSIDEARDALDRWGIPIAEAGTGRLDNWQSVGCVAAGLVETVEKERRK